MAKEKSGKGYERFLNQHIKIIYYDNPNHVNTKFGLMVSDDDDCIIIFSELLKKEILIPKDKIIRVELE